MEAACFVLLGALQTGCTLRRRGETAAVAAHLGVTFGWSANRSNRPSIASTKIWREIKVGFDLVGAFTPINLGKSIF
jgi:hypothetical protein